MPSSGEKVAVRFSDRLTELSQRELTLDFGL